MPKYSSKNLAVGEKETSRTRLLSGLMGSFFLIAIPSAAYLRTDLWLTATDKQVIFLIFLFSGSVLIGTVFLYVALKGNVPLWLARSLKNE